MQIIRHSIGDKVIALTNPENSYCQPRKKGKEYIVTATMFCPCCGEQMVNLNANKSEYPTVICGNSGKHFNSHGLAWTFSKHFAKTSELAQALEEAVENEDYELAVVLRDREKSVINQNI